MPFGATALGIGSLIGGGLGLWGAASANSANKQQWSQTKEGMGLQHTYNKELADIAWQRQKEMYERTYKDESYANRVAQMKSAGLNVGLMYSGGSTAGGGSGTIGNVPQAQGVGLGQAPNAQAKIQTQMMGAQLAMQNAQALADIDLKKAQAKNLNVQSEKTAGADTAEAKSRTAVNWQNVKNLMGQAEGQQLENEFSEIRNRIKSATEAEETNSIIDAADIMFEESEMAYERKLQSMQDTEQKQRTTQEAIEQMAIMTKQLALDLIETNARIQLTEAQREAIWVDLQIKAEGNQIMVDRNRITESIGRLQLDQSEKNTLIGAVSGILQAGFSAYMTGRIARAMMKSASISAGAKTSTRATGYEEVVRTYNSAGALMGVKESSRMMEY